LISSFFFAIFCQLLSTLVVLWPSYGMANKNVNGTNHRHVQVERNRVI
jgi:hypothetical protein